MGASTNTSSTGASSAGGAADSSSSSTSGSATVGAGGANPGSPNILVDTDIQGDVDDVGALAILNAMVDNGEANFLGVVVNTPSRWGAPCVGVINQFYGRPGVPIGTLKPNDDGTGAYNKLLVDTFPSPLKDGGAAPEAVATYRKILAAQPAQSVTIASVGFLTNLAGLLKSNADANSPLDGIALVTEKVKLLVVMGGEYPSGHEYNFYGDAGSSSYAVAHWPTRMVFTGYALGVSITSGNTLEASVPQTNPVRVAYNAFDGSGNGRSSWDLTAVYFAVRGAGNLFMETGLGGANTVQSDGSNTWQQGGGSNQTYLVKTASDSDIANAFNQLMTQSPHGAP